MNILFVDDNKKILETYKRHFSLHNEKWKSFYAQDAVEAIDYLTYASVDIVITDLEMPLFNGVRLLEYVKTNFPAVIRVIISACDDNKKKIETVKVAHRFLSKPCSFPDIEKTLESVYYLYNTVISSKTRGIISAMESIPTLPELYLKVLTEVKSAEPSLKKIGKLISEDVGMSADILKLVNSSFFGLPNHVASPEQAVTLLGFDIIEGVILSVHLFETFSKEVEDTFPIEKLMKHSVLCGNLAKTIATHERWPDELKDLAMIAGILHDLGKLVFFSKFKEQYEYIFEILEKDEQSLAAVEKRVFGACHGEIGAYILGLWGLPDILVESVAYHHRVNQYRGMDARLLLVVHIADYFSGLLDRDYSEDNHAILDRDFIEQNDLSGKLDEWYELCKKQYDLINAAEQTDD